MNPVYFISILCTTGYSDGGFRSFRFHGDDAGRGYWRISTIKKQWVKQMKKMVIFAVFAGLLCSVPMVSAQTKIRAEGMAVIISNRVDIAGTRPWMARCAAPWKKWWGL